MAKSKKRRKLVDPNVQLLSNLTGFDTGGGGGPSMEDCMAELQHASTGGNNTTATETATPPSSSITQQEQEPPKHNRVDLDRIESWNRSFLAWVNGGTYAPGLLPNMDQELARHFQVQELSTFLLKQGGTDIRMPVWERWLLDSRFACPKSRDPILPISTTPTSEASQRLVEELRQNGRDESDGYDDAERIVAEVCRKTNMAGQELLSQTDRYLRQSPFKKGDTVELEEKEDNTVTLLYARKKWKKPFTFHLNREHYDKLHERFFRIHNNTTNGGPTTTTTMTTLNAESSRVMRGFHIVVMALLLRYSSLSGGQLLQDLRGGGMQGAIHEQVFDVLQSTFDGPWLEGFASPFNMCLPVFGSAFPDLDWHFGSIGNFMETEFGASSGCVEVNPPFSPGVMNGMVEHMEDQLDQADRNDVALTFCVIVPTAKAAAAARSSKEGTVQRAAAVSFQQMVSSGHCRLHIRLAAREHGYVEGAQHLRPTRYKESSYDTSVIVLQSAKGRSASSGDGDSSSSLDKLKFERDLKAAFASRHLDELNERRKNAKEV
jgi:phosphorylated CTD-interacting factor 1